MSDSIHTLRRGLTGAALFTTLGLGAPVATAQEVTPTHTYEAPLILPPFTGSVVWATTIAPPAGENIVRTDVHLEWTTDGTQAASAFFMEVDGVHEQGPFVWSTTGGELGWGAGAQTWVADLATADFNGTLLAGPFGVTTFDLTMDADGGGGLWGVLGTNTRFYYRLGPHLETDVDAVSLGTGGTQTLDLNAGPTVGPGLFYAVVGTASGLTTSLRLAGVSIPIVPDEYTNTTLALANQGPFGQTLGVFGPTGRTQATIDVPAGLDPNLAGLQLHHAFLLVDPLNGELLSVSNADPLTLVP